MHNELGITKEDIRQWIEEAVQKQAETLVNNEFKRFDVNKVVERVINDDKYFDNVTTEVWNYRVGSYQVLLKYLKDRKGKILEDAKHYCKVITALNNTVTIQKKIDDIYPGIEKEFIKL